MWGIDPPPGNFPARGLECLDGLVDPGTGGLQALRPPPADEIEALRERVSSGRAPIQRLRKP